MKRCPNCGYSNNDFNSVCDSCGKHIPEVQREYFDANTYRTVEEDKAGVLAFVFGILSIFCCSIIFGPLAIIKGNEANNGMGTAGKVLGIIGLCLWALGIVVNLIFR